jgi:glycogen debranching enzyme
MWSGWGIRTLSAQNSAYNPLSYQCGSVWPHDNGIIAIGFKQYGFAEEAAQVARAVSDAGSYFALYQMPELYAGIEREDANFPVQYPDANVPQAWAAGSVFTLLQALIGFDADAPRASSISIRCCPIGCPTSIWSTFASAEGSLTSASGATARRPASRW